MTTYQPARSYSGESSGADPNWYQNVNTIWHYRLLPKFIVFQATPSPSDVATAVHTLLSSTKRLQEVLRLWSSDKATEGDVSDMYVKIGHEFNATISAFAYYQIDLRYVPKHYVPWMLN